MWMLTRTLLTLAAVWSASGAEELKASPFASTIVQPPLGQGQSEERKEIAQSSAAISQPDAVSPAGVQVAPIIKDVDTDTNSVLNTRPLADNPPQTLKEIPFTPPNLNNDKPVQDVKPDAIIPTLNDKPVDTAESKAQNIHDSVLNAKPLADNPPQILKEVPFTPPNLNNDKPVQDVTPVIIPTLNDKPIDTTESKIKNVPDSVLNTKPLADNPPQILKDILFTPPKNNNDKPVQDVKLDNIPITPTLNDKPIDTAQRNIQNSPDSVLNAKPPAENPPQILKEILFTPPNLNKDKPVQDVKPDAIIPTLNDKPIDTAESKVQNIPDSVLNAKPLADNPPQILKEVPFTPPNLNNDKPVQDVKPILDEPLLNAKPNDVSPDVNKPVLLSPHSPAARAVVFPPADDSPAPPDELLSEELKQKLEDSLIRIKEAINEASPALIAAASDGASKVKVKSDTEDKAPEKPEEPTQHKTYAEIIGHFVTQLLEIPIVFIGAVREAMSGLFSTKVSIQVTHPNQHQPVMTSTKME